MPTRIVPLVNGEYYHVFNRGVARMPIFLTNRDYERFKNTFTYYKYPHKFAKFSVSFSKDELIKSSENIIEIVSYCLMPNHFHFLLKQTKDNGIMNFIRMTTISYAKYFNIKRKRKGPLFEGQFKVVHVESNEQLLHLSRYIHLNPIVSHVINDLDLFKWSSYLEYLQKTSEVICANEIILDQFKSIDSYEKFVLDHKEYGEKLENIKHLILEETDFPDV
ncbi:MAG TPA: transposase [Patescibacteria group bacterium]|nr:transposase [Patescibacteria group bacterium]